MGNLGVSSAALARDGGLPERRLSHLRLPIWTTAAGKNQRIQTQKKKGKELIKHKKGGGGEKRRSLIWSAANIRGWHRRKNEKRRGRSHKGRTARGKQSQISEKASQHRQLKSTGLNLLPGQNCLLERKKGVGGTDRDREGSSHKREQIELVPGAYRDENRSRKIIKALGTEGGENCRESQRGESDSDDMMTQRKAKVSRSAATYPNPMQKGRSRLSKEGLCSHQNREIPTLQLNQAKWFLNDQEGVPPSGDKNESRIEKRKNGGGGINARFL